MSLPKRVEHRQPKVRRDVASALRSAAAGLHVPSGQAETWSAGPRSGARRGSRTRCAARTTTRPSRASRFPDRDEQGPGRRERFLRMERDNADIQKKVDAATNSLARTFDRIVLLLTERGYVEAVTTDDGDSGGHRRTASCWRGSTARATFSSPNVCAAVPGTVLDAAELAGVLSCGALRVARRHARCGTSVIDGATPGMRRALVADPPGVVGDPRRRAATPAAR